MPPKKAKKTKKQIEEEKKKLEEEKRIQEELDRKREEEEAKKRTVEEEKRRVEEEKRRAEEEKRLFEEREKWIERDSVMAENRVTAAKAKRKDLDEKYLLCDPLPDPENEKDLTTFITMWSETKDKSLEECVIHCQTSEEVIRQMQNIYIKKQCDTSIKAGHETHGMLNICIPGQFTEEAIDRCHQYSYIDFMDTIKKTLRITRLLSFT